MDLHIHSNISLDGAFSVEEILSKAQQEKAEVISITDHNSALAHVLLNHINKQKYFDGQILPGAEIDTICNGVTFELLAYNFDVDAVQAWLYKKFATVDIRQTVIRDRLLKLVKEKGFKFDADFPWDKKFEYAHINVFNNIIRYEENHKLFGINIENGSDFYRYSTTNKDFPLYLDMTFLWADIKEVVNVIHTNGGVVVLAHPFGYRKDLNVQNLLQTVLDNNVDGIEVFHPKHTKEQEQYLLNFAKEHKLLIGGGSDWHSNEDNKIIPFAKLEGLLERIK